MRCSAHRRFPSRAGALCWLLSRGAFIAAGTGEEERQVLSGQLLARPLAMDVGGLWSQIQQKRSLIPSGYHLFHHEVSWGGREQEGGWLESVSWGGEDAVGTAMVSRALLRLSWEGPPLALVPVLWGE